MSHQIPPPVLRDFFNSVTGDAEVRFDFWTRIAFFAASGMVRIVGNFGIVYSNVPFMYTVASWLQRNIFRRIRQRPGASALPNSSGEAISRFRQLNKKRSQTALVDHLFDEIREAIYSNAVALGTGIILIMASEAIAEKRFTIGDFALFVYYLKFLTEMTWILGYLIAKYEQTGVSVDRMVKLLQGGPPSS
ncbi:MAG: hypothetical protein ACI906_002730 [Candidatus Latescibacterota bacterium]|jgi:hypothetical protein